MDIYCCSFASESFLNQQKIQKKFFLEAEFDPENIFLYNPNKLNQEYFDNQPNANEKNKYGWYSFKPYFISTILDKLNYGDLLLYLDVNDKPIKGIKKYILDTFIKNKNIDLIVPSTNYPNIRFLSIFHRNNLSKELILSSLINFQPEAGALIIRNTPQSKSIIRTWYHLTLTQAFELDKHKDIKSRHDQETLFLLSRLYKSIKVESWFFYKLFGLGVRKFVQFESLKINK